MAVTKTTHSIAAGHTNAQFMDTFLKQVFIDAGWMTDWHDSFINGSSHTCRVMELTYDATKAYGKTHILFSLDSSTLTMRLYGGGWNSTTKVPTGTQYLDYFDTSTNTTTNAISATISQGSCSATVYRSAVNSSFSLIYWGGNMNTSYWQRNMFLIAPGMARPNWIDLDKVHMNPVYFISADVYYIATRTPQRLRRSALYGQALNGSTSQADYLRTDKATHTLSGIKATANSGMLNISDTYNYIPSYYATVNPAFSSNVAPVVTGYPLSSLTTDPWPSDFGFWAPYGTQGYVNGDILQIAAGTNEWEVIDGYNYGVLDRASHYLLARVVG